MNAPFLLFDAGGTLVFPDERYLCFLLANAGLNYAPERLRRVYYLVIRDFDRAVRAQEPAPRDPWPEDGYVEVLLGRLGLGEAQIAPISRAWNDRHLASNLWAYTDRRVVYALAALRRAGYRMAVFSNSDGRTARVFADVGLDRYLERIFDSAIIGMRKPDVEAFLYVVKELGASPAATLYIGDIYTTDIEGAWAAGLGALHVDPYGLYAGWPGVHLRSVSELPRWLRRNGAKLPSACFQPPTQAAHSPELAAAQ